MPVRKEPISKPSAEGCPFCPGNERLTPQKPLRFGKEHAAGWSVRVVPNKFQALVQGATPERTELGPVFLEMGGYGFHELVIESSDQAPPAPSGRAEFRRVVVM